MLVGQAAHHHAFGLVSPRDSFVPVRLLCCWVFSVSVIFSLDEFSFPLFLPPFSRLVYGGFFPANPISTTVVVHRSWWSARFSRPTNTPGAPALIRCLIKIAYSTYLRSESGGRPKHVRSSRSAKNGQTPPPRSLARRSSGRVPFPGPVTRVHGQPPCPPSRVQAAPETVARDAAWHVAARSFIAAAVVTGFGRPRRTDDCLEVSDPLDHRRAVRAAVCHTRYVWNVGPGSFRIHRRNGKRKNKILFSCTDRSQCKKTV